MSNKIINLYIPNWLPCAENKKILSKILNQPNKLEFYDWKIKYDNHELALHLQDLKTQLKDFFIKQKTNKQYNVFVDSFSQLIFVYIYDEIREYINEITFINPFDDEIFLKSFTLKKQMLPLSNTDAVYKYIFLCKSLQNFRDDKNWLDAIHNEVKWFNESNLIFHKLFDEMFKRSELKYYLFWLRLNQNTINLIVAEDNPLIKLKKWRFINEKRFYLIKDCGFCIWLEKPEQLAQTIQLIIQKK